jgi:hypothetical protein
LNWVWLQSLTLLQELPFQVKLVFYLLWHELDYELQHPLQLCLEKYPSYLQAFPLDLRLLYMLLLQLPFP